MEDFMKYAYHVRCRLGYSIFRGWRVLAIASVESGQPLLNMPEMDPYTDIVLSACCTDNRRPNAKVTDRGRTIIAIKSISKGEEVVTHSGAPDAALQSAGLVRLIASSSLARAMHMDIFASEDESEDEKVCTKQQRRKGMVNAVPSAALKDSHANGTTGAPQHGPQGLHSQPKSPFPPSAAAHGHPRGNPVSKFAANSGSKSHHPPPTPNGTTATQKPLPTPGKQLTASPCAPHTASGPPPPNTALPHQCQQQERQANSHTLSPHAWPSHASPVPQPSLPPPLLPPPWLHLQQNVYVGAAAHVQACEGMGAESDEDMEGKGRGRKSMRGRGGRSLGKRAGQRVLKGGGTWKPFVCQCSPQQGKVCADEHSCLNRAQHVECTPGVCGAGELCQNQRIQRMQSPYLMLRHVGEEKGWGVLAGEPVPAGAFIVQYTGEVVTKEEASKRLQQYEALRIPHYYLMTLSTELVVDATRSGSLGRFVNHSSQPNCVTEKWLVEGREVVIITAKRDVAAGEELCYDYNCANQIWFSCI
ncbi:hypothetical protein DUNSADRAFT_3794 [Dunaliella salina]|uniref:SET domain-containing protein n=1 Tax=Dunaliella salina TaxID=3046 RepID=A0ABQ7GTC9_DUNSA|nr:hypothetical protein DUNSADRAFT_3794 [Dunaliella salina]|eukprot:KAF5837832.1 hypothetical protein DUNSADRAFT_3794 [Dunaliella salina]